MKALGTLMLCIFFLTGCSDKATFLVTEVSEYQEEANQYMKIVFKPENIPDDVELKSIKVGGVVIKEAYLIEDNHINSPAEWEKNKVSNLPVKITEGETHAVLIISEDPEIKEQKRLLFDYIDGNQVISVESDFLK